jgi:hypothetical protein
VRPGDLVVIASLPRHWGARDIRGEVGLVVFQSDGPIGWFRVLVGEGVWTVPGRCMEVVSDRSG